MENSKKSNTNKDWDSINHPRGPFPHVFMDITGGGEPMGRIIFKLYEDTPKTSENFRGLCTGEYGKHLHYKGSHFHNIQIYTLIKGGGDLGGNIHGAQRDNTWRSIYGKYFPDENYNHKHDKPYLLGMANLGEYNTNAC